MLFKDRVEELMKSDIHRSHQDLLDDVICVIFEGRCIRCGVRTNNVHEIVPRSHGKKSLDPSNRVTLCPECHLGWAHSNTFISISVLKNLREKLLRNLGYDDYQQRNLSIYGNI